jgi:hypothetical protein
MLNPGLRAHFREDVRHFSAPSSVIESITHDLGQHACVPVRRGMLPRRPHTSEDGGQQIPRYLPIAYCLACFACTTTVVVDCVLRNSKDSCDEQGTLQLVFTPLRAALTLANGFPRAASATPQRRVEAKWDEPISRTSFGEVTTAGPAEPPRSVDGRG